MQSVQEKGLVTMQPILRKYLLVEVLAKTLTVLSTCFGTHPNTHQGKLIILDDRMK